MEWDMVSICDLQHYSDIIKGAMASQVTSLAIVHSIVYSDAETPEYTREANKSTAI